MAQIKVGGKAPDFTLKDHRGQEFKLSSHKGEKVLLSFHPLAWTSICAQQMQALEEHFGDLQGINTVTVGISVDSVPCKKAWAESLEVEKTPLLADFWPHGGVAQAYGIFRKEGFSERANIILDSHHRVAWVKIYPIRELPDIQEVLEELAKA